MAPDSLGLAMALAVVARCGFNGARIFAVKCWRRSGPGSVPAATQRAESSPAITILVPVLRERSLAGHLASLAVSLADEGGERCRVVVVGTRRERAMEGQTTLDLVASALAAREGAAGARRVLLFEADGSDRCKADQMMQALAALEADGALQSNDAWIGVYDADSSPEPGTLTELLSRIRHQPHRAYQQPPLYILGWDAVLGSRTGWLEKALLLGRAVYSHLFAYKESLGYLLSGTPLDTRLNHFTGHGYFIRMDLWRQIGGFQAPSCDTTLGYRVSLAGEAIGLLWHRDRSQIPARLSDFVSQTVVWFNGCQLYGRELRHAGATSTRECSRIRTALRIAGVAFRNASWAYLPYLWTAVLLWDLAWGQNLAAWGGAVAAWVLLRAWVWLELLLLRTQDDAEAQSVPPLLVALTPLLSPAAVLINGLGPLRWYTRRWMGRKVDLVKTPRPG